MRDAHTKGVNMRKIIGIAVAMMLSIGLATSLIAAESNFDIKAGASNAKGPDKWGFDMGFSYNYGADKYLAIGIEPSFQWLNYDQVVGTTTNAVTGAPENVIVKQNVYTLPLLTNFRLRVPNTSPVTPFFTAGVGYGWTFVQGSGINDQYDGLAWQITGGSAFSLGGGGEWGGETSSIQLLLEVGYRGYKPVKRGGSTEIDMSGLLVRGGVRFSLGGGGGSNW